MLFKGIHRHMVKDNPYFVVAVRKRKRESSERLFLWTKIVLVVVVSILLREPLSIYLLTNTANRLDQLLFRTGAVLVAITALQTYTDVVRHPERLIFGVHPIRARWFLTSVSIQQLLNSFLYVLLSLGIWSGVSMTWLSWIAAYVLSTWLGGIGIGYAVHLGSVWAAKAPVMSGVLDSIRGSNPREQAAFIYAPGVALAFMGVGLIFGAGATRLAIEGRMGFAAWILAPVVIGIAGWMLALRLAETHLIRASMILSDIDAHWGVVEEAEDEGAVYLDWLAKDNAHRLRILRQSWRLHRWVTIGLWTLGGVVALIQWLGDDFQVLLASGLVATTFTVFPTKLLKQEPQWLQWSLGIERKTQWRAITEVCGLVWLSYCLPICVVQIITDAVDWYVLVALGLMVPLYGLVAWFDLGGWKKQGLAVGMLCSTVVWLSVIGIGG